VTRPAKADAFWQAYLASLPQADEAARRFYDIMRIGNSIEAADKGAALIMQGVKTATSSLLRRTKRSTSLSQKLDHSASP
jgi:uncharacterized protein YhfF